MSTSQHNSSPGPEPYAAAEDFDIPALAPDLGRTVIKVLYSGANEYPIDVHTPNQ